MHLASFAHYWPFVSGRELFSLYLKSEQPVEQTFDLAIIWDAMALMWCHRNWYQCLCNIWYVITMQSITCSCHRCLWEAEHKTHINKTLIPTYTIIADSHWLRHRNQMCNVCTCILQNIIAHNHEHHTDVIMTTVTSQITSLTVVYSTVYSDADQRKHQSSASLAFVRGIHRDRWIPRTKDQLRGKCFHLMTSSWEHAVALVFGIDKLH